MSGEEFVSRLADIMDCKWTILNVWHNFYEVRFKGKEGRQVEEHVLAFSGCQINGYMLPSYASTIFQDAKTSHNAKDALDRLVDIIENRVELCKALYIADVECRQFLFLAHGNQSLEAMLIEAELNFTKLKE